MKIRFGPISSVLWLCFLWLSVAFWIAGLLGIRHRQPLMFIYNLAHWILLYFVAQRLEEKLAPVNPQTGEPVGINLTPPRKLVLVIVALLWIAEYIGIYVFAPHLLSDVPFTILVVPLLVVVTIIEGLWRRQVN
jgi:hypothetical protein